MQEAISQSLMYFFYVLKTLIPFFFILIFVCILSISIFLSIVFVSRRILNSKLIISPFHGVLAILLFSFMGVIIGFFSGNSRTSVIGDTLPAVITFVASVLGFMFTKEKPDSVHFRPWINYLPIGMVALIIAMPPSVILGSKMRADAEIVAARDARHDKIKEKIAVEDCAPLIKLTFNESINNGSSIADSIKAVKQKIRECYI